MRYTESNNNLKKAIEAILFLSEKPVRAQDLAKSFDTPLEKVIQILRELKEKYSREERGIKIREVALGFRMETSPEVSEAVRKFFNIQNKKKLSKSSLEVLAIIAYKGPLTKRDIEIIRGTNSEGSIRRLLELELIKIAGRKKTSGRPYLFKVTDKFLEYFGLRSLDDLPSLIKGEGFTDGLKKIAHSDR